MRQAYHHSLLCFGAMVRRYINTEEIMIQQCVLTKDKKVHEKRIEDARKYEKVCLSVINIVCKIFISVSMFPTLYLI